MPIQTFDCIPDAITASLTNQRIGDTVVYVLLPSSASQLVLRRLLSLVPPAMETCFVHLTPLSALHPRQLEALAFEVYDRMPRLVKRVEVRGLPMDEAPVHLQYPSFTLAPDGPPKPAFTLAWPLRSYDVLNKWRLAHCAYGYDARTEMLVAFAIDAEGEEWRVKTWRDISGPRLMECIEGLWEFFTVFATTAAIEWRLTLSRLGAMSWDEYDGSVLLLTRREGEPDENIAWRTLIATKNAAVTILTVDPPLPLGLSHTHTRPTGPHITPAILADPSMRIVDESLLAHIAIFPYRNSVNLATSALEPTGPTTIYAMTSFLFSIATNGGYSSYVNHVLTHRSAPGKEDENVEQLLGREWYRLSCLGRMRFGFDGALPVHLEGVRIALECFDGIVGNDWH